VEEASQNLMEGDNSKRISFKEVKLLYLIPNKWELKLIHWERLSRQNVPMKLLIGDFFTWPS